MSQSPVSNADAVLGFAAFLTALPTTLPLGKRWWASPAIDLAHAYNETNGWQPDPAMPSVRFPDLLAGNLSETLDKAENALFHNDLWSVYETAPKDGSWVLLADTSHTPTAYLVAQWKRGLWWSQRLSTGQALVWKTATHWRPLNCPTKKDTHVVTHDPA